MAIGIIFMMQTNRFIRQWLWSFLHVHIFSHFTLLQYDFFNLLLFLFVFVFQIFKLFLVSVTLGTNERMSIPKVSIGPQRVCRNIHPHRWDDEERKEREKKSFMHFHNKHIENTNTTFHPFPSPLRDGPCNKPALSHTDRMTHATPQNVWAKITKRKKRK